MSRKHRFESETLQYLFDKYVSGNTELESVYEQELINAKLARSIYLLRIKAKLRQSQLAKLANTTTSVISRLEDPNYKGHSLSMVSRIAGVLGQRVEVEFVPVKPAKKTTTARKKVVGSAKRSSVGTSR